MDNCTPARGICVAIILVLVLVWNSLYVVEPTQVGIDLSLISYQLFDAHPPGRHPLGLGHRIIHFDTKLVTVDFSSSRSNSEYRAGNDIVARTSDGLEVELEVSFQYHFNITNIKQVYEKFGEDAAPIISLLAIDTVTRESTKFNASYFFSSRTDISEKIRAELEKDLIEKAFCEVDLFQLRSVSLPSVYEAAIQATEVAKQDFQKAEQERPNREVVGQTTRQVAIQTAQTIGLQANATAETIYIDNKAYIEQFNLTQKLQAQGFSGIYASLNQSEADLLEYMDVRALRDHPSSRSVISIPMKS